MGSAFTNTIGGCCCCPNSICIEAYSMRAVCESSVASHTPPDCAEHHVPAAISGAVGTVRHTWPDGLGVPQYGPTFTCTTDESGRCCMSIPVPLANPATAPTVDPTGGGASGGALAPDTYTISYTYLGSGGETAPATAAQDVQVGIADSLFHPTIPPAFPTPAAPDPGGALAPGTYYAAVIFRDAAGHHNRRSPNGPPIVVAHAGDAPLVTVPALSLRTNATAYDLYVYRPGDVNYRLYKANQTAAIARLDLAYDAAAALVPNTNTSLINIPRVTFTPGGDAARVYWKSLSSGCGYKKVTASPVDLDGTRDGTTCPPGRNTTRDGTYEVTIQPPDSVAYHGTVTLSGDCFDVTVSVGFCSFKVKLDATDARTAAPVAPISVSVSGWPLLGGLDSTGAFTFDGSGQSTTVGFAIPATACVFYEGEEGLGTFCGSPEVGQGLVQGVTIHYRVTAAGYHDRCFYLNHPCSFPAYTFDHDTPVVMYAVADWVPASCCGECPETLGGAHQPPNMLPMTLHGSFQGPEGMTGSTGPVSASLAYNAARSSAAGTPIYDACTATGGWGYCAYVNKADYQCLKPGPDPYNPCDNPTVTLGAFAVEKKFYGSARMTWSPCAVHGGGFSERLAYGVMTWDNYWGGGCPSPDTPPSCGTGQTLVAGAIWCLNDCPCGIVEPDGHAYESVAAFYPTKSGSTYIAPDGFSSTVTSGSVCSPVNWSQAQHVVYAPGFNLCPDAAPIACSGTVTE